MVTHKNKKRKKNSQNMRGVVSRPSHDKRARTLVHPGHAAKDCSTTYVAHTLIHDSGAQGPGPHFKKKKKKKTTTAPA